MEKQNLQFNQVIKSDSIIPVAERIEVECIQNKETAMQYFPVTDPVSLAQRLKELERTDRSKLSTADKISFLKERYIIQYQLDKQRELINVPFIITVIGIILLTLLL